MKHLKSAILSASLLLPLAYPLPGLALDALTYQQALRLCAAGYDYGCAVAYQYQAEVLRQYSGSGGGSPADAWVSPSELTHGGVRGVRPGALTTYDFIRD